MNTSFIILLSAFINIILIEHLSSTPSLANSEAQSSLEIVESFKIAMNTKDTGELTHSKEQKGPTVPLSSSDTRSADIERQVSVTSSTSPPQLTKEECEKTCSSEQCQEQIWGQCSKERGSCPSSLIVMKCGNCRDLTPNLVKSCIDIYKTGEPNAQPRNQEAQHK